MMNDILADHQKTVENIDCCTVRSVYDESRCDCILDDVRRRLQQGQRALELLRELVARIDSTPGYDAWLLHGGKHYTKAKALLEASDEQHPKP